MLTKTEAVWRHLLVGALERGQRRYPSISAIASELGLGVSTVHKALDRPTGIGAVIVHPSRGVRVVDPWRLLLLWAGRRNLAADLLCRTTSTIPPMELERDLRAGGAILGGFGGLVDHLGENSIASYDTVVCYGEPIASIGTSTGGPTTLLVLVPDPLLTSYGEVAPFAQCFVDLFNLPGWQAARFVVETAGRLLADAAA